VKPAAAEGEPSASARPSASSRAGAARPAAVPSAAKPARRDSKAMSADVAREIELLRKRQDKWILYGWIVAGVMIVIAGGAWLYSKNVRDTREEKRITYETTMKSLADEFRTLNASINSIPAAEKVIARAEETKTTVRMPDGTMDTGWNDSYVDGVKSAAQAALGKATSYIKTERDRTEVMEGLANLELAVKDAANKKPEELAQLRRRVTDYEGRGQSYGVEFEARVSRAKVDLNRAVARRLFDEAKAVAAKGEARAALNAYAKAEDELRSLMDEAHSKRNQDAITWVEPLYQQCMEESDKIAYAAFTPEQIDKVDWIDVLNTPAMKWVYDGLGGFRSDNGQVHAIGSPPGSKKEGVFSVGDLEYWRDFVMEIEFVPVKGTTKLYWRLGKQTNAAPDEFPVDLAGGDGFKPNQTYSMTVSYIGSRRVWDFSPDMERDQEVMDPISWRRQRVGAFGAAVSEGAEFKITKLRIKVLRGGKPR
jgi:hypothetical protein